MNVKTTRNTDRLVAFLFCQASIFTPSTQIIVKTSNLLLGAIAGRGQEGHLWSVHSKCRLTLVLENSLKHRFALRSGLWCPSEHISKSLVADRETEFLKPTLILEPKAVQLLHSLSALDI